MQGNINIPDSTITTNLSFRQLVLMNMQQLTNFPYIEKDFDALTDYELLCLVVKYLNDVIANQNEQNDSITRMYESFLALQTYVNNTKDTLENAFNELDDYVRNYFDNLDVQDEINNKLEAMAESGQLTDIIAQYLGLAGMIAFDTVADMKQAQNLVNGSKCRTLGYHSVNDGGGAYYKIRTVTNDDVVDEMFIIEVYDNLLVAELIINDETNIKNIGAYGDNTHNDTSFINAFINKLNKLIIPDGTYLTNSTIILDNIEYINIKGTINYSGNNYALNIKNCTRKDYFINNINSINGSGILIENMTFSKFTINNFTVSKNCVYLDGTDNPITVNNFYGLRWNSQTEDCVYMFIDSSALSTTFVTENNFHNIDFWTTGGNKRAIITQNLSANSEIQYNLYGVNLESTNGLKHVGNITAIGIYNCRTDEIVFKSGWLSFNGSIPNKMTILGNGALFPNNIEYLNTTYNLIYLDTNLIIQDNITNNQFRGGGVLSKDIFRPKVFKNIIKSLSSSDFTKTTDEEQVVTGSYELVFSNGCNYVNFFNISNVSDINKIEITIPYILANDIFEDGLIVHIPAGLTSLTIKRNGGGSRTITSPSRGAYKFIPFFNGFMYIKIEDNY